MKKAFIFIALILFTFTLCAEATTIDKDFLATLNDVLKESGYEVVKKKKVKDGGKLKLKRLLLFMIYFLEQHL